MFTGLIRTTGEITALKQAGDLVMTIRMHEPFTVSMGASIACHGICLTVVRFTHDEFDVQLSAETLARSNADAWQVGTRINLEPSLQIGGYIGGHFVSGHVDCLGQTATRTPSGDSTIWTFTVPHAFAKFIAPKGSITIDGVSLTVNTVVDHADTTEFSVNIIPHTAEMTGFRTLSVGDAVNIEIDMLARYVARIKEVGV